MTTVLTTFPHTNIAIVEQQLSTIEVVNIQDPTAKLPVPTLKEWLDSADVLLGYPIRDIASTRHPQTNATEKWIALLARMGIDLKTQIRAGGAIGGLPIDFSAWSEESDADTAAYEVILGEEWPEE